jgi:ribonuclease P/MRP protein subunit POP1
MAEKDGKILGEKNTKADDVMASKGGKNKRKERKLKNEPTNCITDSINAFDYVTSRAKELSSMLHAVQNKGGAKRTFQKLPRHMRRRAMSYNLRRLPWKQREQASKEMESIDDDGCGLDASKKVSRRKRRKPKNLLSQYVGRQGNKAWLETHLWHSKRMRMVDRWGYRLALESCSKGIRVNYRFMKNGCLLSDISYYCCIELRGNQSDISSHLSCVFSHDSDFHSDDVISGRKEGVALMHHPHKHPYNLIGPVWLLWKPNSNSVCKLWVWSHPSIHEEVLSVLTSIYSGACTTTPIHVTDLKNQLLRFRLVGPKSLLVLTSMLSPPDSDSYHQNQSEALTHLKSSTKWVELCTTTPQRQWLQGEGCGDHTHSFKAIYEVMCEGDKFPVGTVVSMVTRDPRLKVPNKRGCLGCPSPRIKKEKCLTDLLESIDDNPLKESSDNEDIKMDPIQDMPSSSSDELYQVDNDALKEGDDKLVLPDLLSQSYLWEEKIREGVSMSKIPDHVINHVRGKFYLKPEEVELD